MISSIFSVPVGAGYPHFFFFQDVDMYANLTLRQLRLAISQCLESGRLIRQKSSKPNLEIFEYRISDVNFKVST